MTPEQREELRRLRERDVVLGAIESAKPYGPLDPELAQAYRDRRGLLALLDALDAGPRSEEGLCGAILNCALPTDHDGLHERADGIRWSWHENIDHLPRRAALRTTEESEPWNVRGRRLATKGPSDDPT